MVGESGVRGSRGRRAAARNALILGLLACMGLGTVAFTVAGRAVPSPIEGAPSVAVAETDAVAITWLGDTLLGDGAEAFIDSHGFGWLSANLPTLGPNDVVVANLEGPLTERTEPFDPMQRWSYQVRPSAATELAALGIDAVSMANNHAMDRGPEGLIDTAVNATAAGVPAFGAGETVEGARLPLLIESPGQTIAVLGFSDEGGLKTASSERPGVRRLSVENLEADIELVRLAEVDRVVAFVHWGENYGLVNERQQNWAGAFAAAGYDLVIGAGPHVPQPISIVDGMPVAYSLGNYLFGTPGRFRTDAQGFGLVVTTSFATTGDIEVAVRCIQTDNAIVTYQPRPCTPQQSRAVLTAVSPDLIVDGDTARMTVPLASRTSG